jgi:hypothetical protein
MIIDYISTELFKYLRSNRIWIAFSVSVLIYLVYTLSLTSDFDVRFLFWKTSFPQATPLEFLYIKLSDYLSFSLMTGIAGNSTFLIEIDIKSNFIYHRLHSIPIRMNYYLIGKVCVMLMVTCVLILLVFVLVIINLFWFNYKESLDVKINVYSLLNGCLSYLFLSVPVSLVCMTLAMVARRAFFVSFACCIGLYNIAFVLPFLAPFHQFGKMRLDKVEDIDLIYNLVWSLIFFFILKILFLHRWTR